MQGSGFKLQNYFSMLGIHVKVISTFCKYSLFYMCQALLKALNSTDGYYKENLFSQSQNQSVSSVAQVVSDNCDPSSPKMPVASFPYTVWLTL